jgi:2-oxoacid:acceptor oxidoreductase gamma subunit (pyruvate/2-ketoisovalerate family)
VIEVRFHGRGGQGAVVASEVLASAAFKMGFEVSSFPFFGVERRGAPVTAFTRIDHKPIRNKSSIYEPDFVVVLDSSLMRGVDVLEGLKTAGRVLVNHPDGKKLDGMDARFRYFVVDATAIAISHGLGSPTAPIVNTAIMGGFARACNIVTIESILQSIREEAPVKPEENVAAARQAYDQTQEAGA